MNIEIISTNNDFEKRLTAVEIIKETAEYYGADPIARRSYDILSCKYLSNNGNKCAYSRCWKEGVYETSFEGRTLNNLHLEPDDLVMDRYKGHNFIFWLSLQRLHDIPTYWDASGLTSEGKKYLTQLIKQYE